MRQCNVEMSVELCRSYAAFVNQKRFKTLDGFESLYTFLSLTLLKENCWSKDRNVYISTNTYREKIPRFACKQRDYLTLQEGLDDMLRATRPVAMVIHHNSSGAHEDVARLPWVSTRDK